MWQADSRLPKRLMHSRLPSKAGRNTPPKCWTNWEELKTLKLLQNWARLAQDRDSWSDRSQEFRTSLDTPSTMLEMGDQGWLIDQDPTREMVCRGRLRMPCRAPTPCWCRASRRVSVHTQRVRVFLEPRPGPRASSTLAAGCTSQARCSSSWCSCLTRSCAWLRA